MKFLLYLVGGAHFAPDQLEHDAGVGIGHECLSVIALTHLRPFIKFDLRILSHP